MRDKRKGSEGGRGRKNRRKEGSENYRKKKEQSEVLKGKRMSKRK